MKVSDNTSWQSQTQTLRIAGFAFVLWSLALCSLSAQAWAQSERMALLIGNQHGWTGEPTLDYVLSGDIRPLAHRLKTLGFSVQSLENQDATQLRKTLLEVKTYLIKNPQVKTFLFYYSGHADQTHLHLGKDKKQPFSYKEFAEFFSDVQPARKIAIFDSCYSGEVIRRFGSLTRYKKLLKSGKTKGIRRQRKIDLHRLIQPKQGHEQGIRIIASSLDVSWELRQHKASVFTYHLLQGIQGPADVNHDGKITVDELFDYTSQRVLQETGQRPQQFLLLKRSMPYAIAPVYRSRLRIGSDVVGKLKVAVANFVWTRSKQQREELRLAVVDGPGTVSLEKKGRCFQQSLRFPKGGEAELTRRWTNIPCQRLVRKRKGALYLEAQPYVPLPRKKLRYSLAFTAGFTQTHADFLDTSRWGGGLQLRVGKHFGIGLHANSGSPTGKEFSITNLWLRPELGWTWSWQPGPFAFDLFMGGYAQIGLALQHKASAPTNPVFALGGGGAIDLSWWITQHFGLRFGGIAGFNFTQVLEQTPIAFQWQLQTSLLLGF